MLDHVDLQQNRLHSSLPDFLPMSRGVGACDREIVKLGVERTGETIHISQESTSVPTGFYVICDNAAYAFSLPTAVTSTPRVRSTLSPGLLRIRARQPEVIRRAMDLRARLGDPVTGLAQVLQDIPVEDDMWDRIAQEPYG